MKLCVDCKHFGGLNFCKHPNNGISLVTGETKPQFANIMRKDGCGEEGSWFESKPEVKPTSWWEMFWSMKK